jgi:hypothetical protein
MRALIGAIILLSGTIFLVSCNVKDPNPFLLIAGGLYSAFGWCAILWRDRKEP